jgi:hypothetical protein
MNVFGAFNFGSLIKTFLPGLLLFFVLLLYLEIFTYWCYKYIGILKFLFFEKPELLAVLSVPISIGLGITLNSVLFSGMSEYLLEKKHKEKNNEFYEFRELAFTKIKEKVFEFLEFEDDEKKVFIQSIDPRFFFLHKTMLPNLMYLRESYWYYLEFQLNTLLAITIGIPAFITALVILKCQLIIEAHTLIACVLFIIASWYFFFKLFMKSANDNLDAHRKKELSLLLGSVFFELDGHEVNQYESKKTRGEI